MARSKFERLIKNGYPLNLLAELSEVCFIKTITLNDCAYLENLLTKNLTEPQYNAILLRYRFKLTCEKCGELLNCSKQCVAQGENAALNKLRELKEIRCFLETGKFDALEKSAKTDDEVLSGKAQLTETVNELKSEVEKLSSVSERLKILDCIKFLSGEKTYYSLHTNVERLDFSARTYNCLVRNNVKYVSDILYRWSDLHKFRNLGIACAWEIIDKIYELGFKLPTNVIQMDGDKNE